MKCCKKDVERIIEIASHHKIIGFGEATHGQEQITRVRILTFVNLVKQCNYTHFVLEENYVPCYLIDHYIQTGEGDPVSILSTFMFPWRSKTMLKLILWMRKYNIKHKNKLRFYGIDCKTLIESDLVDKFSPLYQFIENKVTEYNQIPNNDWIRGGDYRDKAMFDIFMQIYNPSAKYFLYAHIVHLSRTLAGSVYKFFGIWLDEKFGKDYYVIGNSFVKGSYLGVDEYKEYDKELPLDVVTIDKPLLSCLPQGLNEKINIKNFDDNFIAAGGAFISIDNPLKYISIEKIAGAFDAIYIIDKETALILIDDMI